jgi:DUF1365 family protein
MAHERLIFRFFTPLLKGVFLEDHWNQNGVELMHSIPNLVLKRLGFFPDGPVHLATTARAFGQCMNPISIFVCWNRKRDFPDAFVLEVHNFPWGEIHTYVIDARNGTVADGKFVLKNCRFPKTLHVSPWQ